MFWNRCESVEKRKRIWYNVLAVSAVITVIAAVVVGWGMRSDVRTDAPPAGAAVGGILIDPGHGGEDGGTQAADGTLEKDINLAIALDLRDMLRVWGYPVGMTRETDVSIGDPDSTTTRRMKVSDMVNRLALYDAADVVLSIHQNHFPVAKYHGTQVFYSVNHPDSLPLAKAVRESVLTALQPDNTRELKKAGDSIFLLYRTTRPAILTECGFLSNPEECARLEKEDYRRQMAWAICGGYWGYLNGQEDTDQGG